MKKGTILTSLVLVVLGGGVATQMALASSVTPLIPPNPLVHASKVTTVPQVGQVNPPNPLVTATPITAPSPTVTNLHQARPIYVIPPNPLVHGSPVPSPAPTVYNLPDSPSFTVNPPGQCPTCR